MDDVIMFDIKHDLNYTGRNGEGQMLGIEVMFGSDRVYFTPVNSKGLANCEQQIPYDCIDALIETLKKAKEAESDPYGTKAVLTHESTR